LTEPQAPPPPTPTHHRRTGRIGRWLLVVAMAIVVIVAAYAALTFVGHQPPPGTTSLVIYTYDSLMGGGCGASIGPLLAGFESAHHVAVSFVCPEGQTLLARLASEKNAPGADLVVGLDEVTTPEAVAQALLVPFAPPSLTNVSPTLVGELDPQHHATPYEWGYLGIDYTPGFANATGGQVANASFEDIAQNSSWSGSLVVEDPTVDITGEEFLLWEIEYATHVLHQPWTTWWQQVAPFVHTAPDWSTAFSEFGDPPAGYPLVVSYTTDPAYAVANGAPGSLGSTVAHRNGTAYGWQTVYGMGIVNGSSHVALDQALIEWFLESDLQSQIPEGEWEYPANQTIPLPAAFDGAVSPSSITALDGYTTPAEIAQNLTATGGYLDQWQTLMNQYG
jgi:thiamine transport system substrate-binding protein